MIYEFSERLHRAPQPWPVHAGGPQVLERPAAGERIVCTCHGAYFPLLDIL